MMFKPSYKNTQHFCTGEQVTYFVPHGLVLNWQGAGPGPCSAFKFLTTHAVWLIPEAPNWCVFLGSCCGLLSSRAQVLRAPDWETSWVSSGLPMEGCWSRGVRSEAFPAVWSPLCTVPGAEVSAGGGSLVLALITPASAVSSVTSEPPLGPRPRTERTTHLLFATSSTSVY